MGGNREARLAGLGSARPITVSCTSSAGSRRFAGVMLAQQLLAGAPTVAAPPRTAVDNSRDPRRGVLIGGTGGIPGTLLGVLVLGTVANGMALMQVQTFYQQIATGVILLLAVSLGRLRLVLEHLIWSRSQEEDTDRPSQPAILTDVVDQAKGG